MTERSDDYETHDEYDFDSMTPLPRGRYAPERAGMRMALLAPDVARAFSSDAELNEALRLLLRLRTMPLAHSAG
jgi:hypothetical protein